ncbi:hypothetical protein L6274_04205 [Candidatus Parcubacteria bacterium]|nr:hypothetical protein [Candidatus Parcubacteria bacterium]MCG2809705.1 hypothetical protein [Candidatus Portnoybacteria bacterium]
MTEKSFVKKLEETYLKEGFYTKKEIGVGYGIADLVLFRPNIQNCLKRLGHKQLKPLLNEGYFKVFNLLPDIETISKPAKLNNLKTKIHYSSSFLKYKLLKDLKNAKYVKEVNGNYYFKINGWLPIGKELIAIEAKLKDWRRGFYQANRYRVFADKAYLAVPLNIANIVDIALLKKHGVGLIAFDVESNTKKIILEARKKGVFSITKRNYASEYFWNLDLRKNLISN